MGKRDELKSQIDNLMEQYDKKEIDGQTYLSKMMNLTSLYKNKEKDEEDD